MALLSQRRTLVRGCSADVARRGRPVGVRRGAQSPVAGAAAIAARSFLCVEHALFGGYADLPAGPVDQKLLQLAIRAGAVSRAGVWRSGSGAGVFRARGTLGRRGGGAGGGRPLA